MFEFPGLGRHRGNRLLAALNSDDFSRLAPHLSLVDLSFGSVLYESVAGTSRTSISRMMA